MPTQAKKPTNDLSFETAMERLEKIVEEMESGKMLLEDLLVRYEEGMKLVKVCQERLAKYKCPKHVRFVETLPKSPIGKILRKELRALS